MTSIFEFFSSSASSILMSMALMLLAKLLSYLHTATSLKKNIKTLEKQIERLMEERDNKEIAEAFKQTMHTKSQAAYISDLKDLEDLQNDLTKEKLSHSKTNRKQPIILLINKLLALDSIINSNKANSNTVVGLMLEQKLIDSNKNSRLLIMALITYLVFCHFNLITFSSVVLMIPLLLVIAIFLDQYFVIYRVRKGWYGKNEYEAREVINYIVSHANKDDFNDDGGLIKLMDTPENTSTSTANVKGWVQAS